MSYNITVCLAGIPIGIKTEYTFLINFCKDYISCKEPLFCVETNSEVVKKELNDSKEPTSKEYAEALCLYREIAERLPFYNRVVFHGASIEYGGNAYLFSAKSGTGKTTHIALWRKFLGEKVDIINGDKPIIEIVDKKIIVHGSPYAGKEGWNRNVSRPLGGICFLSQGKDNSVKKTDNCFTQLFTQTYKPKDKTAMIKTIEIVKRLSEIPCYSLSCDMSENAVKASFSALTGEIY